MNNIQKSLLNTLNEVIKVYYEKGLGNEFRTVLNYNNAILFTTKQTLSWEFLEEIVKITDKKFMGWSVNINEDGNLYIKISK